jgi:hypothetical protein
MKAPALLVLAALPLLGGCATPRSGAVLGWQCTRVESAGDVSASSTHHLNPDGTPRDVSSAWSWQRRGPDADIEVQGWFSGDNVYEREHLAISITLGRPFRGRVHDVEIGAEHGGSRVGDPQRSMHGRQTGYLLVRPVDAFLALPRPVHVSAFDRQGRLAFRIPVDVDAVQRAIEAMERAKAGALEATRHYRTDCAPEREERDRGVA